jgi:hypothetical protein
MKKGSIGNDAGAHGSLGLLFLLTKQPDVIRKAAPQKDLK